MYILSPRHHIYFAASPNNSYFLCVIHNEQVLLNETLQTYACPIQIFDMHSVSMILIQGRNKWKFLLVFIG